MKPKISVIVPIYNTGKYLYECLLSIEKQTYKEFEVLMIYTNSFDNSLQICKSFVEKDVRFKLIINEKNVLGAAYARNLGLKEVKGTYLVFVDSDDFIAEDMFEILLMNLLENNANISICQSTHNIEVLNKRIKVQTFAYGQEELQEEFINGKFLFGVTHKLFCWDLIKNIEFENIQVAEDVSFLWKIIQKTDRIVLSEAKKYYYRYNPEGLTKKIDESKFNDCMYVYKKIIEDTKDNERFQILIQNRLVICCAQYYITMRASKTDVPELKKKLDIERKNNKFRLREGKFPKKEIVEAILFQISPRLLYIVYLLYQNIIDCVRKLKRIKGNKGCL